jgi:hypothetical protein
MITLKKLVKTVIMTILISSCSSPEAPKNQPTTVDENQGTLTLVANGEDFVRQGFITKDGWQVDFDHVYVTLNDVVAYQTEPPYDPESEQQFNAKESVNLISNSTTVDLAAGDENAKPIQITQVKAPFGNYNALAWKLVNDQETGASIVLEGKATKKEQTINFLLSFSSPLEYVCGEFIGEERKGIFTANTSAELETTFHFDHIFGDADTPMDDDLNVAALGFEPLAKLSENNQLKSNLKILQQKLNSQDYQKLQKAISSLGHVGEGHCRLQNQPS